MARLPAEAPPDVGAILLAAGRSQRMAGEHKLLAQWRGKPLVSHAAAAISAAGLPPPIVVLGARADAVRAALAGQPASFVTAPDYALGMSRSLRAGLAAVPPAWRGVLVCLADMPRVEPETLAALATAIRDGAGVAVPRHAGRRGNPVAWSRRHFPALLGLDGDTGARALLAGLADDIVYVESIGDGIFEDVDTSESLAMLRLRGDLR